MEPTTMAVIGVAVLVIFVAYRISKSNKNKGSSGGGGGGSKKNPPTRQK